MRIPLLSEACAVALVAGLLIDAGAAVSLRHDRGRQLNVESLGGDPAPGGGPWTSLNVESLDGDQEVEDLSHFLPSTNVTCFQGRTAAMTTLLESLRVSPLRDLYNETKLNVGSCIDTGYDLGPIDTCFGKTFMSGLDPDKQTQVEHRSVASWAAENHETEEEAWSELRKLCVLKATAEAPSASVEAPMEVDSKIPSPSLGTIPVSSVAAPPAAATGDLLPLPLAAYKVPPRTGLPAAR